MTINIVWYILALGLRILIAPLYHHSDPDNYYFWGKYLWEKKDFLFFLGKAVPNAMPATYPPIFYYLLFFWRGFYVFIGQILWWINIRFPLFPSGLIFWYQSYEAGIAFNKIPAILTDLGCAYLIYLICKNVGESKRLNKLSVLIFLFLPAAWYNSAFWGQIESIYSFFILLAFLWAMKNKFLWGTVALGVSALIKPTGLFVLPIFIIFIFKKKKIIDLLTGGALVFVLAVILYFPFQPLNTFVWMAEFYFKSFRGELNYLTSNAFNFWALLFGFDQRPDSALFLGIPFSTWGFLLFSVFLAAVCFKLWERCNSKNFILAAFLCAFASFLFLPRMHERYFYTSLIFAAILGGIKKKWFYTFILLSLIHILNLYHFWWQPKIPLLISLLSNLSVVRGIIVLNIAAFLYLFVGFWKDEIFNNHC